MSAPRLLLLALQVGCLLESLRGHSAFPPAKTGAFGALRRFVDHVLAHDRVWLCRGIDIARHWRSRGEAP